MGKAPVGFGVIGYGYWGPSLGGNFATTNPPAASPT
jgi:hypothetical protein